MAKKIMIKVAPPSGDPKNPTVDQGPVILSPGKTPIDQNFDLRDRIYELIGSQNNLKPGDQAAIYANLTRMLGKDRATKVMDHTYLFNAKPEYQKLPIEERIKHFYDIGSNDPDVQDIMTKTKVLGYGTGQGFRTSQSQINQALAGRIPITETTDITPDVQKKIMLKVTK
jgi:hypothetical protein